MDDVLPASKPNNRCDTENRLINDATCLLPACMSANIVISIVHARVYMLRRFI